MNPVAFQIGGVTIYWYGILIVASVLAGAYVAGIQARKRGQDPERVWDALLICLILGVVGARLYHVLSSPQGGAVGWSYYRENPLSILKMWEGGLALLGALAGGVVGMVIYTRVAKLSTAIWLDIAAPAVLLAQAIGRWGNYINQELYGPPTTLPWGIRIDAAYRISPYTDLSRYPSSTLFHPLFLYESLWCLLGFILLWWVAGRFRGKSGSVRLLPGDVFCLYVAWYAVGRFLIEFLRPDAWKWGPVAVAQIFCALALIAALAAMIYCRRRPQAAVSTEGQAAS